MTEFNILTETRLFTFYREVTGFTLFGCNMLAH